MRRGRLSMTVGLLVLVAIVAPGCLTVGLDSEFRETTTEYRDDGSVETETVTQWTQNAKGGPFTDIESMKQDTSYIYQGPDDVYYEIGQGSGATGVSGAGQVAAFESAMEMLSVVLDVATTYALGIR